MTVTDGCLVVLTGTAVYLAIEVGRYLAALLAAEDFWLQRRQAKDREEAEYRGRGFE